MRINYNTERLPAVNCRGYSASFFFFFFFSVCFSHQAHHCGCVYSQTFIHRYNTPLAHSFTHLCMFYFLHMYILHCPWSQCAQCSFLGFSQLNISEAELKLDLNCENVPDIVCKRIDSVDFQK